jgi:hypothetical protein
MKRHASITLFLLNAAATTSRAFACPLCDSEVAQETRAGIFNEQFFSNLLAGMLPFAIVSAIALAVRVDWSSVLRGNDQGGIAP